MKPKLEIQPSTLWDYPSQQHREEDEDSHKHYIGATPSYIIWNLLMRYTKPKDLVLDPMAGSGTTIDTAREIGRRALGYDISPLALKRRDIFKSDARTLPVEDEKIDFVFIDPPYSDHIKYSNEPNCIGRLNALENEYYDAMEAVIKEAHRVMKKDRYMALYVSDSYEKDYPFMPIGFKLFGLLEKYFLTVDIVSVKRYNKNLNKGHWKTAALEHNYFLRGFNYLFIMYKQSDKTVIQTNEGTRIKLSDRRI